MDLKISSITQDTPKPQPTSNLKRKIHKDQFLALFKSKQSAPNSSIINYSEKVPELFSVVLEEPENYKKILLLDPNDAFLPASTPPVRHRTLPEKTTVKRKIIPKSPFTGSKFAEDPSSRVWFYIDEMTKIQGPFTSLEMDHWYDSGYFFHELLIRFKDNNDFIKLIDLFGKVETIESDSTAFEGSEILKYAKKRSSGEMEAVGGVGLEQNIWEKLAAKDKKEKPQAQTQSLSNLDEPVNTVGKKEVNTYETPRVQARTLNPGQGQVQGTGEIKRSNIKRDEKMPDVEKDRYSQVAKGQQEKMGQTVGKADEKVGEIKKETKKMSKAEQIRAIETHALATKQNDDMKAKVSGTSTDKATSHPTAADKTHTASDKAQLTADKGHPGADKATTTAIDKTQATHEKAQTIPDKARGGLDKVHGASDKNHPTQAAQTAEKEKVKLDTNKIVKEEGKKSSSHNDIDNKASKPSPRSEESDEWIESIGSKRGQVKGRTKAKTFSGKQKGAEHGFQQAIISARETFHCPPTQPKDETPNQMKTELVQTPPQNIKTDEPKQIGVESSKKETKEQSRQEEDEAGEEFIKVNLKKKGKVNEQTSPQLQVQQQQTQQAQQSLVQPQQQYPPLKEEKDQLRVDTSLEKQKQSIESIQDKSKQVKKKMIGTWNGEESKSSGSKEGSSAGEFTKVMSDSPFEFPSLEEAVSSKVDRGVQLPRKEIVSSEGQREKKGDNDPSFEEEFPGLGESSMSNRGNKNNNNHNNLGAVITTVGSSSVGKVTQTKSPELGSPQNVLNGNKKSTTKIESNPRYVEDFPAL